MSSYCFSLSLDGAEQPTGSGEFTDSQSAVHHGRELLLSTVARQRPATAYCVVYASETIGSEPLGVWDVSREAPMPVWTPEE